MNAQVVTKCAICGAEFVGWGNNPWPITEKGECCRACNFRHVIPARIALLHKEDIINADNGDK